MFQNEKMTGLTAGSLGAKALRGVTFYLNVAKRESFFDRAVPVGEYNRTAGLGSFYPCFTQRHSIKGVEQC